MTRVAQALPPPLLGSKTIAQEAHVSAPFILHKKIT
jgi:hypothetical protein